MYENLRKLIKNFKAHQVNTNFIETESINKAVAYSVVYIKKVSYWKQLYCEIDLFGSIQCSEFRKCIEKASKELLKIRGKTRSKGPSKKLALPASSY